MSAHGQLRREEYLVAGVVGTGLFLAILGAMIDAFGTDDSGWPGAMLIMGIGLMVIGTVFWMMVLRPWEQYDDLQTAYYTGHHGEGHEEHEAHVGPEAVAEAEPVVAADKHDEQFAPYRVTGEHAVIFADEAPAPGEKVAAPAKVETVGPDDLKIIEGVGPKVEAALQAAGIKTFAQLAATAPADLERIVKEEQKVRIVGSTVTWVRQAKLIAAGDLSALDDLKKRIKSGYLYDHLTEIEGIGEEVQAALYEARIRSFDDLAVASVEELQKILDKAGLKKLKPDTWPKQAEFIVKDDLSGLEAYKAKLSHGHES